MQAPGRPPAARTSSPSPTSSRDEIAERLRRAARSSCTSIRIGVDTTLFRPDPAVPGARPHRHHRQRRRAAQGRSPTCIEAVAKLRTERDVELRRRRQAAKPGGPGREADRPARPRRYRPLHRPASPTPNWSHYLRSAEVACVPSLLRGLLAARGRGDGQRHAARRQQRAARCPRWPGPTGRPRCSCRRATSRRWPGRSAGSSTTRRCGARLGAAGRARVVRAASPGTRSAAADRRRSTGEAIDAHADGTRAMLTVDFDRLHVARRRPGARPRLRGRPARVRVLPARRATSSRSTRTQADLRRRRHDVRRRWQSRRGAGRRHRRGRRAATRCACPSPTALRLVIASEILEHIPDDTRAIAEMVRVLQARRARSRSPCRAGGPSGSAGRCPTQYHARSRAATSASTSADELRGQARARPGCVHAGTHHAHALHSPVLVAQVRCRRGQRRGALRARRTTSCWSGTSCAGPGRPGWPSGCSTR